MAAGKYICVDDRNGQIKIANNLGNLNPHLWTIGLTAGTYRSLFKPRPGMPEIVRKALEILQGKP